MITSPKVRAFLLASALFTPVAAAACSANPAPVHSLSDYEIAEQALKNAGYGNIYQVSETQAGAAFDDCTMIASFTPTSEQPLLVTGTLVNPPMEAVSLGSDYLPTIETVRTLSAYHNAHCAKG